MKRFKFIMAILLTFTAIELFAQSSYNPTTTWPYLYSDFQSGELQKHKGDPLKGSYNIHLAEATLHFIDGTLIKEASPIEVFSVKIGSDIYSNVGGRMMKILAKSDNGFIAEEVLADFNTLNSTGGAYGSSSTSIATQALSSLEGIGGSRSNMNHMELRRSKDEGQSLPVVRKLYLVFGGKVVFAAKKDVCGIEGVDKKVIGAFIKENKVKWKDPQSLIVLLDYIAEITE